MSDKKHSVRILSPKYEKFSSKNEMVVKKSEKGLCFMFWKPFSNRNGGQKFFIGRKGLGELKNCMFNNVLKYYVFIHYI